jgi:hypothetical protein
MPPFGTGIRQISETGLAASDAIYSAPPCALAVTMLREPGADLETDRWSGREKAAVDNDFQTRHERGFVSGKKCNGVCYFAWIAWALHQGPGENRRTKPAGPRGKPSYTAAYCVPHQTPATTIANSTMICPRITRATSAQVVPRRSRSTFPPRWA